MHAHCDTRRADTRAQSLRLDWRDVRVRVARLPLFVLLCDNWVSKAQSIVVVQVVVGEAAKDGFRNGAVSQNRGCVSGRVSDGYYMLLYAILSRLRSISCMAFSK